MIRTPVWGLLSRIMLSRADWDELRVTTARLKSRRLKFPQLGSLLRVRKFVVLTVTGPYAGGLASIVEYNQGELLLLVHIDFQPRQQDHGTLVDPAEAFFMGRGGAIVTTGIRAGADIFAAYDVL